MFNLPPRNDPQQKRKLHQSTLNEFVPSQKHKPNPTPPPASAQTSNVFTLPPRQSSQTPQQTSQQPRAQIPQAQTSSVFTLPPRQSSQTKPQQTPQQSKAQLQQAQTSSVFTLPPRASSQTKPQQQSQPPPPRPSQSSCLFELPPRASSQKNETMKTPTPSSNKTTPSSNKTIPLATFANPKPRSNIPVESRLDCLYWVKKPAPDNRCSELIACPVSKAGSNDESFPLFVETPKWIGVPRFLGKEMYGPAKVDGLTLGDPMNPDISFTWTLQDTPQKPQKDAVNSWLKTGEGVICVPCGAGKTVIGVYLALLMHRRTLILVQNTGLLKQWVCRIRTICPGAAIGIVQQKRCEIAGMDFVIGMMQTVRQSTANFDSIGMVIVDETHHIAARTFSQSVTKVHPRYILGLSATPERKDGLTYVVYGLVGPLVFKSTRQDIHPQTIRQIEYPDGNQKVIKYKNGMLGMPTMVNRMVADERRNKLIGMCIHRLFSTPGITKVLVISDRREHCIQMNELYGRSFTSGLYVGGMKEHDMEESKTKQLIFASYPMAKEFLDIDALNGMVLATPCIVDAEQVVGRLRENTAPQFPCANDDEYEEELDFALGPIAKCGEIVKNYLKSSNSRTRIVYDIVDPFDIFDGLAWKRYRVYKSLKYHVNRIKLSEFLAEM